MKKAIMILTTWCSKNDIQDFFGMFSEFRRLYFSFLKVIFLKNGQGN